MGKSLLIIVVGFSTIFSSTMFTITSNQQHSSQAIANQYYNWLARNAAESVANVSVSKLYRNINMTESDFSYSLNGAACTVTLQNITGDSTTEAEKIMAVIAANYNNERDTVTVILMKPAYSYYHFLLHNWPNFLEYGAGDTLVGPIHTNSMMRIRDNPIFIGKYSTNQANYQPVVAGDDPRFYGSAEFGTAQINMQSEILTPLTNVSLTQDSHVLDIWVEFNGTTYTCYSDAYITALHTVNLNNVNRIVHSTQTIHVKGTVDGQITVFAENELYIDDNIVCSNPPFNDPSSNDFIGLIAHHRIVIADNAENRNDLNIHAAIMSQHDEIFVDGPTGAGSRGILTIVGSIIEQDHVAELESEYMLIHLYDIRLIDKTPPYFPRLDRYEVLFRSD